jgi:hypothetical protein
MVREGFDRTAVLRFNGGAAFTFASLDRDNEVMINRQARTEMNSLPTYILTCVICGRKLRVPEQYLERVLAKFKCLKCKTTGRPIVHAE